MAGVDEDDDAGLGAFEAARQLVPRQWGLFEIVLAAFIEDEIELAVVSPIAVAGDEQHDAVILAGGLGDAAQRLGQFRLQPALVQKRRRFHRFVIAAFLRRRGRHEMLGVRHRVAKLQVFRQVHVAVRSDGKNEELAAACPAVARHFTWHGDALAACDIDRDSRQPARLGGDHDAVIDAQHPAGNGPLLPELPVHEQA